MTHMVMALVKAAAENGSIDDVIAQVGSVDATDENGRTALMLTAPFGTEEALRRLLSRGANTNAHDGEGFTALILAATAGRTENVRLLLDAGGHVNARDHRGGSALLAALGGGHEDVATLLLDRGADASARMKDGTTTVSLAETPTRQVRPSWFGSYRVTQGDRAISEALLERLRKQLR